MTSIIYIWMAKLCSLSVGSLDILLADIVIDLLSGHGALKKSDIQAAFTATQVEMLRNTPREFHKSLRLQSLALQRSRKHAPECATSLRSNRLEVSLQPRSRKTTTCTSSSNLAPDFCVTEGRARRLNGFNATGRPQNV